MAAATAVALVRPANPKVWTKAEQAAELIAQCANLGRLRAQAAKDEQEPLQVGEKAASSSTGSQDWAHYHFSMIVSEC